MPAKDGTGPSGQGSRTGRGLGDCPPGTQVDTTNSQRPYLGRLIDNLFPRGGRASGTGRGSGRGRGGRGGGGGRGGN
jgi:hypothetical protein